MSTSPKSLPTRHGRTRIAERGVNSEAPGLPSPWGPDLPAGQGCVRRALREVEVAELLAGNRVLANVEALARLEAVIGNGGAVVTVDARGRQAVRILKRSRRNPSGRRL